MILLAIMLIKPTFTANISQTNDIRHNVAAADLGLLNNNAQQLYLFIAFVVFLAAFCVHENEIFQIYCLVCEYLYN